MVVAVTPFADVLQPVLAKRTHTAVSHTNKTSKMSSNEDFSDLSLGEQLAHFGGDTDAFTAYHCGEIDEWRNPIDHDGGHDADAQDEPNSGDE